MWLLLLLPEASYKPYRNKYRNKYLTPGKTAYFPKCQTIPLRLSPKFRDTRGLYGDGTQNANFSM